MSNIYTSSQIKSIPQTLVSKKLKVLDQAEIKSIILPTTAEGKESDLEKRLVAIEENLDNDALHTTTEEAKELVRQIQTLLEEGEITKITEIIEDFKGLEDFQLATDSLKDFHAKINGDEDGSLETSNLKTNLEENIKETKSELTSAYEKADAELNGRITALEGQINGVNGAETNSSTLKTEIKETIDSNKTEIEKEYKAADVALSKRIEANEGKLYGIDITVEDAIESAKTDALNDAKDYTDTEIGKIDAAYKVADVALSKRIEANEGKLYGIDITVEDAIESAKTDAISTANANATAKAEEALNVAKDYTDIEIEKLESTVGQPATTDANGTETPATGLFARIKANESNINDIKSDIGSVTTKGTILERINTVESSIDTLNASNTTEGSIANAISDATTTITDAYEKADDELSKRIEDNESAINGIKSAIGTESTDESPATGLFEKVANNKTEIDGINKEISTLQTAIGSESNGESSATGIYARIAANESAINDIKSEIGSETTEGTILERINTVESSINTLNASNTTINARIAANESAINGIKSVIGTEETTEGTILERINAVESSIDTLNASNTTNGSIANAISDATTTIIETITKAYEEADTKLSERIDANESAISNNTSSISVIKTAIGSESNGESAATGIYAKINANESNINAIKSVIGTEETTDKTILERINTVESSINTLNASNTTINDKIEALESTVKAYQGSEVTVTDDESDTKSKSFTVLGGAMYAILSSLTSTIKLGDKQIGTAYAQEQRCLMATENGTFTIATDATDTTNWEVEVYQINLLQNI